MRELQGAFAGAPLPAPRALGRFVVDDGAELAYQVFGASHAPAVAIAGALGVGPLALASQIAALSRRYRVICWDYRGTGGSRGSRRPSELTPPRLARDFGAVLDQLAVGRAMLIGWGLGVGVALELVRQRPALPVGFVALCGSAGRPLRAALPGPLAWAGEQLVAQLTAHPQLLDPLLERAGSLPRPLLAVLQSLLPVGAQADRELVARGLAGLARADQGLLLGLLLEQVQHDASDVVALLDCPLLVIAGTRDRLTPPAAGRALAAAARQGELREVEGGGYFAALEQPEVVNRWLLELARRVFPAAV